MADHPAILAPPPLLVLGVLGLTALAQKLLPWDLVLGAWWLPAAMTLCLAGAWFVVLSVRTLLKHQTPVDPYRPVVEIVSDGPYAFSRNPIYLGLMLIYLGSSLFLHTAWSLAAFPVLFASLNFGVVLKEEEYLKAKFGQEYEGYRSRVRRWL